MDSVTEGLGIDGLAALDRRVQSDLSALCYPPKNWVPETTRPKGEGVSDVVIIGGGMGGLAACFALLRAGIRNLRILDRAAKDREGPWVTYARMETLRSPKQLLGPASGMASLTFRAWYTALHGVAAWDRLDKIPRPVWMDYLIWYRHVLALPVENDTNVETIRPDGDLMKLALSGAGAKDTEILTRRVVLATGREGLGSHHIPDFMAGVPKQYWAHSSEDIDFSALKGKRVVVVGVGAAAVDNAAEALEAGASEVRHLIRRNKMPQINKMMGVGSFGLVAGFPALPEEWRWRYLHYNSLAQTPAPHGSTLRVSRHANAYFHFGVTILGVQEVDDTLNLTITKERALETDFIILGTGFNIDPAAQPMLGDAAKNIKVWGDCYAPPPGEENAELAHSPYLNKDFSFMDRDGATPWLDRIHCFNHGSKLSLGNISGDIPAISDGAGLLAREVAAKFYAEDIEKHWRTLQDYDTPELLGDEWTPTDLP
jgi:FAD-dependent urate hydroxylase